MDKGVGKKVARIVIAEYIMDLPGMYRLSTLSLPLHSSQIINQCKEWRERWSVRFRILRLLLLLPELTLALCMG